MNKRQYKKSRKKINKLILDEFFTIAYTKDEYKAFQEELGTPPTGFASGGQVKNSLPDFTNPAIINAIFKELQHG